MTLLLAIVSTLFLAGLDAPHWISQTSGVTSRLRGVSAVSERVAWASGAGSTVLRTTDGGATWNKLTVTTDPLDFRDIDAIDAQTAYVLSIGNGPASRIYKTTDSGATWKLQFQSEDAKAFFDAMSFWDADHGIVIGDSIDGRFCILSTENGGRSWVRVSNAALPPALPNEGAFAASGTNIAVFGKTDAWIATGASSQARVLRTHDRGRTWKIAATPIIAGPSAGIFSIAFRDSKHGVIVGGDYTKERDAVNNLAMTSDGGVTWKLVSGLSGYRSVVAYVPGSHRLVAVGPSGADQSIDDGNTWTTLDGLGFDTVSFARSIPHRKAIAWAAGARGSIGRLMFGSHSATDTRPTVFRSQVPLVGRVEYADGSVAKGAHVEALTACAGTNVHVAYGALTNSEGRFSIERYDPTCNNYVFSASHREAFWLKSGDDVFYTTSNGTTPLIDARPGKLPSTILIRLAQQGGEVEIKAFDKATQSFIFAGLSIRRDPEANRIFKASESIATGNDGSSYVLFLPPGNYVVEVERYMCHGKHYFAAKPPAFRFSVKAGERQPLTLKIDIVELQAKSSYDNPGAKRCSP